MVPHLRKGESMVKTYTTEQIAQTMTELRAIFDLVRVVDPVRAVDQHLSDPLSNGQSEHDYNCYSVWTIAAKAA